MRQSLHVANEVINELLDRTAMKILEKNMKTMLPRLVLIEVANYTFSVKKLLVTPDSKCNPLYDQEEIEPDRPHFSQIQTY